MVRSCYLASHHPPHITSTAEGWMTAGTEKCISETEGNNIGRSKEALGATKPARNANKVGGWWGGGDAACRKEQLRKRRPFLCNASPPPQKNEEMTARLRYTPTSRKRWVSATAVGYPPQGVQAVGQQLSRSLAALRCHPTTDGPETKANHQLPLTALASGPHWEAEEHNPGTASSVAPAPAIRP